MATVFDQFKKPIHSIINDNDKSKDILYDLFSLNRDIDDIQLLDNFWSSFKLWPKETIQLLFHMRDIRNGRGEKKMSQLIFKDILIKKPDLYKELIPKIVEYGYYKDLLEIIKDLDIKQYSQSTIDFFKEQLLQDFNKIKTTGGINDSNTSDSVLSISLCAKWAPSENGQYEFIAKLLAKTMKMSNKKYRIMISKLRSSIGITETYMSSRNFKAIDFNKVPSKCHTNHRKAFSRTVNHKKIQDPNREILITRYEEYLEKLKEQVKNQNDYQNTDQDPNSIVKVNTKGLQVHEIINKLINSSSQDNVLLECQWATIVNDIKKIGTFDNSIAVSDVSGSMRGIPMLVSISLGLLLSECCEGPYKNKIISFSENPELYDLSAAISVSDKIKIISDMQWDMSTNMTAVFDKLLNIAVKNELKQEQMIKKIFVFTDMEFNCATSIETGSDYFKEIELKYNRCGYTLPVIVLWNLRSTDVKPFNYSDKGIISVSGFSQELLKSILENTSHIPTSPGEHIDKILEKYNISDSIMNNIQIK